MVCSQPFKRGYGCGADMIYRFPNRTRQKVSELNGPLRRLTWTSSRPCLRSSRVRCNLHTLNGGQRRKLDHLLNAVHFVSVVVPMITLITPSGPYILADCIWTTCRPQLLLQKKIPNPMLPIKRRQLYNHPNPEHCTQIRQESVHQPSVAEMYLNNVNTTKTIEF